MTENSLGTTYKSRNNNNSKSSLVWEPINTKLCIMQTKVGLVKSGANRQLHKRWRTRGSDFYVVFTMSFCALGLKQLSISLLFQIIRL